MTRATARSGATGAGQTRRWLRGLGAGLVPWLLAAAAGAAPPLDAADAVRRLGPPGLVWVRLAVEEESPAGPWTPLAGVEFQAYPTTPALVADLERIRRSARGSGSEYETAIARLQAALAAYQVQVEVATRGGQPAPPPPTPPRPDPEPVPGSPAAGPPSGADRRWRAVTDAAGIAVFDAVPAGEWLLVAVRVTPLRQSPAESRRAGLQAQRFLTKPAAPFQAAEVWMAPVRVVAGERVPVLLTDRSRWMAGPVR